MTTDPIADMLTRIRNAYSTGNDLVKVQPSKIKEALLAILKENDYIKDYYKKENLIMIELKYIDGAPAATKLERVSSPGRRVYVKKDEIPTVLSGKGLSIISTSKGIMSGVSAKKERLGGELIARVY